MKKLLLSLTLLAPLVSSDSFGAAGQRRIDPRKVALLGAASAAAGAATLLTAGGGSPSRGATYLGSFFFKGSAENLAIYRTTDSIQELIRARLNLLIATTRNLAEQRNQIRADDNVLYRDGSFKEWALQKCLLPSRKRVLLARIDAEIRNLNGAIANIQQRFDRGNLRYDAIRENITTIEIPRHQENRKVFAEQIQEEVGRIDDTTDITRHSFPATFAVIGGILQHFRTLTDRSEGLQQERDDILNPGRHAHPHHA